MQNEETAVSIPWIFLGENICLNWLKNICWQSKMCDNKGQQTDVYSIPYMRMHHQCKLPCGEVKKIKPHVHFKSATSL